MVKYILVFAFNINMEKLATNLEKYGKPFKL
jgi:hypothetical protein